MKTIAISVLLLAVLSISLGSVVSSSMTFVTASTEEGVSDSGDESGATENQQQEEESTDDVAEPEPQPETEPEPEPEPETEPETSPPGTIEPPVDQEALPICDGSAQKCITNDGNICDVGQGGHECECSEDMSDCPNHPSLLEPPIEEPTCPPGQFPVTPGDPSTCVDCEGPCPETPPPEEPPAECDPQDTNCDGEVVIPEPTPCLLDPSDESCPEPVDGICPEGYNMNEDGNCFPEHDRCPTNYHSHEDDETGRCIPDSTPCDEGFIMNPDFPSCDSKESVCRDHPNIDECKEDNNDNNGDDNNDNDKEITIIVNKIIKETNEGKHHTGFPDVDIIGLSVKENGDAMICAFDIDDDRIECQEFGMEDNKVNQDFWRVIETDSSKDYDSGNTGSSDIDDAIEDIKSQDFSSLEDADNHNFGIDLAWIAINPQGEGVTCLTTDQSGKGKSLCEPFKVSAQDVDGQITEGVEFK